jgi:nicotinamidase-related amidase
MDRGLRPETTTLVVMDVQERLVAAMPDEARSEALDNVIRLVQGARILGMPVVVTEQYPTGLGPTVASVMHALEEFPDPPGSVAKVEFDACRDPRFTGVLETTWQARLKGAEDKPGVVLCGMETHICVYQTARSLVSRGIQVQVPHDAACSRRLDNHRIAQSLIERAGALVTGTETVLFELLGRAGSEEFKAISKLVR